VNKMGETWDEFKNVIGSIFSVTPLGLMKTGAEGYFKSTEQVRILEAEGRKKALSQGFSEGYSNPLWSSVGTGGKQPEIELEGLGHKIKLSPEQPVGIDTSTGASGTRTKSKTTEGGLELSGFINPIIYIGLIILIFMLIKGR